MLAATGCLTAILTSDQCCPYSLPSPVFSPLELIHAVYFIPESNQYFSSSFSREYRDDEKTKRIFHLYRQALDLIDGAELPSQVHLQAKHEKVYLWFTSEYKLFLTLPVWIDITTAALNDLVGWFKSQTRFFFFSTIAPMH